MFRMQPVTLFRMHIRPFVGPSRKNKDNSEDRYNKQVKEVNEHKSREDITIHVRQQPKDSVNRHFTTKIRSNNSNPRHERRGNKGIRVMVQNTIETRDQRHDRVEGIERFICRDGQVEGVSFGFVQSNDRAANGERGDREEDPPNRQRKAVGCIFVDVQQVQQNSSSL